MYFDLAWSDELTEKYKDDYSEAEFYVWFDRKVKIFLYSKTGKKKDNVTKIVPIKIGVDPYDIAREYAVRMYRDDSKNFEVGKVVHALAHVRRKGTHWVDILHDGDGRYGVLLRTFTNRSVSRVRKGTYELKSEAVSFAHQIMKEIAIHGYIEFNNEYIAIYSPDGKGKFTKTEMR